MLDESAWLAICFFIFVGLAYRPGKNAILKFLDDRIAQIKLELDTANLTKDNATKELAELKANFLSMEKKHKDMVQTIEKEIEKNFEERCSKFKKSLEYMENSANEHIDQMRKNAVAEMEKELLGKILNLVSRYFQEQNSTALDIAVVSTNTQQRRQKK